MADATFAQVSVALEQRYRRKVTAQPNRATLLLNLAPKTTGRGKNVAHDISVGTDVGQVFDDGADVAVFNNDTEVPITHPWAEYGDAFAITGRAEDAAAGDGTELANLWLKKLGDACDRAAQKVQNDLMTGAGTASPQLLYGLFSTAGPLDSTGTYGGQARGTYPQWAGNKLANAGVPRPIQATLIETAFTTTYIASGTTPDFCITTPALWQRLADQLFPDRRYPQTTIVRGQQVTFEIGYEFITINGVPIFKDKDIPAGNFVGLNFNHFGIEILPTAPDRLKRAQVLGQFPIAGTRQEQAGASGTPGTPLMVTAYLLARTGNKTKVQLLCTIQTWSDKCNAHFWLTDLVS